MRPKYNGMSSQAILVDTFLHVTFLTATQPSLHDDHDALSELKNKSQLGVCEANCPPRTRDESSTSSPLNSEIKFGLIHITVGTIS